MLLEKRRNAVILLVENKLIKYFKMDESSSLCNDEDPVKLPDDTLAILNEFLQNKKERESLESHNQSNNIFEENWVNYNRFVKALQKIIFKISINYLISFSN